MAGRWRGHPPGARASPRPGPSSYSCCCGVSVGNGTAALSAMAVRRLRGGRAARRCRRRGSRRGRARSRRRNGPPSRFREAAGGAPSRAVRGRSCPRSGPRRSARATRDRARRPRRSDGRRWRPAPRRFRPRWLAFHAQDPAHHVDALCVPAGVDAETGRAADCCRVPRRRRVDNALLDVRVCGELRGLVSRFGRGEGPGAGRDPDYQGPEVVERAPRGACQTETADFVLRVDAHRYLRCGRTARARGTRLRAAGLGPDSPDSGFRRYGVAAVSLSGQGMRREGVRGRKRWRASLADGAGGWVDGRYGRVEDEGDAGCRG